jgi:uncharacterized protein (UPF0548 family)
MAVLIARPSNPAAMHHVVEGLLTTELTYADVGATLGGRQPDGFHHDRYETSLGRGREAFREAARGLKIWAAHRLPGVRVFPADQEIITGATVVVTLGTPRLALAAPCRIVRVIDRPDRWGFAYGTLPGHPEQGEEAFVVSVSPDENVRFEIVAFSRPGAPLVRCAGPIGRELQRRATRGYLRALERFVGQSGQERG